MSSGAPESCANLDNNVIQYIILNANCFPTFMSSKVSNLVLKDTENQLDFLFGRNRPPDSDQLTIFSTRTLYSKVQYSRKQI